MSFRLSEAEIKERMKEVKGWELREGRLRKEFRFKDFNGSVEFVNRVRTVAEEMNHHPDICIYYNRVVVELFTHSAHGITELDFKLAKRIDQL
jgi:4a-hydroxytetrahydrobiopterin dehydratase